MISAWSWGCKSLDGAGAVDQWLHHASNHWIIDLVCKSMIKFNKNLELIQWRHQKNRPDIIYHWMVLQWRHQKYRPDIIYTGCLDFHGFCPVFANGTKTRRFNLWSQHAILNLSAQINDFIMGAGAVIHWLNSVARVCLLFETFESLKWCAKQLLKSLNLEHQCPNKWESMIESMIWACSWGCKSLNQWFLHAAGLS